MGQSIAAKCTCCGYTAIARLGANRANHLTYFAYPHICRDCRVIFSGNLYGEPCACTECGSPNTLSYESRKARRFRRSDDKVVAQASMLLTPAAKLQPAGPPKAVPLTKTKGIAGWLAEKFDVRDYVPTVPQGFNRFRELRILDKGYLCPRCDKTKLEFCRSAFLD